MSEPLDRAVDARLAAYRPDTVPPFTAIEARKRGRDRRRIALAASALSVAALAGAGIVIPALSNGGDRLTPGAVAGADARTDALARQCVPGPFRDRTQDFRGLTEQEAQEKADGEGGYTSVLAQDGECLTALANLDTRRVSLVITDGKVTWAGQEGRSDPFAWTGARICADIPDEQCRQLDADQAQALDRVLLRAVPAPADSVSCTAMSTVYRVVLEGPGVKPVPYEVPDGCGPVLKGGRPHVLDPAGVQAVKAAFNAGSPEPQDTRPDDYTDCRALRPGDSFDFQNLRCDGGDDIRVETMDCVDNRVYVYLARDGRDDLEGMTGVTNVWLHAEPRDPSTGRTPFAFQNCKEHG